MQLELLEFTIQTSTKQKHDNEEAVTYTAVPYSSLQECRLTEDYNCGFLSAEPAPRDLHGHLCPPGDIIVYLPLIAHVWYADHAARGFRHIMRSIRRPLLTFNPSPIMSSNIQAPNYNHTSNVDAGSKISRHINLCIYISFGICCIILAFSLGFGGYYSLWISEVSIGLTIIHHSIVLSHRSKLRKMAMSRDPSNPGAPISGAPLPIPVSSRKPMIFFLWFIALVYLAASGVVIMFLVWLNNGWLETDWENKYIVVVMELIFLVIEVGVIVRISLWCMKERRAVLGAVGDSLKWYHLPQYNQSSCEYFFGF